LFGHKQRPVYTMVRSTNRASSGRMDANTPVPVTMQNVDCTDARTSRISISVLSDSVLIVLNSLN